MSISAVLLAGGQSQRFGINKLKIKTCHVPILIDQLLKLSFFFDEIIISTSIKNYSFVKSECHRINVYKKKLNEFLKNIDLSCISSKLKSNISLNIPGIKVIIDNIDDVKGSDRLSACSDNKIPENAGPIGGIYTGLKNTLSHNSFIIALDMPFLSFRMIDNLTGILNKDMEIYSKEYDAIIIKSLKGFEVLSGLYSKNCIDILEENIKDGDYKISNIFKSIEMKIINEEFLRAKKIDMLNFFNINDMEDYRRFRYIWRSEDFRHSIFNKPGYPFFSRWSDFFFR